MTDGVGILDRMQSSGLTDPLAGELITDLATAGEVLGKPLQYAQPIEAEVPASKALVAALLPRLDESDAAFLGTWQWQEEGHANSQLHILKTLGLEPGPTMTAKTTALSGVLGKLATTSGGLHDVVYVSIMSYMALGEKETQLFYRSLAGLLHDHNEQGLARVIGKTARQEGLHLAYQETAARDRYALLAPWQQRLVGQIIKRRYMPVGIQRGNTDRMRGFAQIVLNTSEDEGRAVATQVQELASSMLEIAPQSGFVARRYKQCIDEFRKSDTKSAPGDE